MPAHRSYEIGASIRAALRRFHRRTEEICRRHGLTEDQYTLLLMIRGAPDGSATSTVSELAQRLSLAQNGVAERVGRAEAANLIARAPSPTDGRVSVLRLTAEGERRLAAAFAELGEESDLLVRFMEGVDAPGTADRDGG